MAEERDSDTNDPPEEPAAGFVDPAEPEQPESEQAIDVAPGALPPEVASILAHIRPEALPGVIAELQSLTMSYQGPLPYSAEYDAYPPDVRQEILADFRRKSLAFASQAEHDQFVEREELRLKAESDAHVRVLELDDLEHRKTMIPRGINLYRTTLAAPLIFGIVLLLITDDWRVISPAFGFLAIFAWRAFGAIDIFSRRGRFTETERDIIMSGDRATASYPRSPQLPPDTQAPSP